MVRELSKAVRAEDAEMLGSHFSERLEKLSLSLVG